MQTPSLQIERNHYRYRLRAESFRILTRDARQACFFAHNAEKAMEHVELHKDAGLWRQAVVAQFHVFTRSAGYGSTVHLSEAVALPLGLGAGKSRKEREARTLSQPPSRS